MSKTYPAAKIEKGLRLQKAGQLKQAANFYRQVLKKDPKQPDALHLLGVVLHHSGQLDEAVELIAESLRINPDNAPAINNLAGVLKDQRRFEESLEFYDAAIEADPDSDSVHSNRGIVLAELGRAEEAVAAYRRSIELNPASYAAYCNLGALLKDLGFLREAVEACRRAVALNPNSSEANCNLGVTFHAHRNLEEAKVYLERALELNPKFDAALTNLGSVLKQQGDFEGALTCYWRALELNPRSYIALNNLGTVLKEQGRLPQAAACYEKALQLKPDFHLSLNNLGQVLTELGRPNDALERIRQALAVWPEYPAALNNLGFLLKVIGQADDAVQCFRQALANDPSYHHAFSNLLFTLNYVRHDDREALFEEHLRFDELYARPLSSQIQPHTNDPAPERRLRIGYVSGDFREHSVAYFIEPVLSAHDKGSFEIFCYSNHYQNDSMTERLKGHADHWKHVASLSDDALADMIRQDQIDILVDLSGHTAYNRLLVFARKPAPIQVTMIGYMQTTGLSTMDYRITDAGLDPVGSSEAYNTEELVRLLAGAATYRPPSDCPPVNELPAEKNGYVTFASFNNIGKITSEALEAWARILHQMPTAKLLIVGAKGSPILKELEELGIGADRLDLVDRLPLREFLYLHHRVDFLLDCFPYNGGTTTLLAVWMGIPFVTVTSESAVSRAGMALLNAVGLAELAATDVDGYVRAAVEATRNITRLAEWRRSLRDKLAPVLGADSGYIEQLEAAFRSMWHKWCAERGATSH